MDNEEMICIVGEDGFIKEVPFIEAENDKLKSDNLLLYKDVCQMRTNLKSLDVGLDAVISNITNLSIHTVQDFEKIAFSVESIMVLKDIIRKTL